MLFNIIILFYSKVFKFPFTFRCSNPPTQTRKLFFQFQPWFYPKQHVFHSLITNSTQSNSISHFIDAHFGKNREFHPQEIFYFLLLAYMHQTHHLKLFFIIQTKNYTIINLFNPNPSCHALISIVFFTNQKRKRKRKIKCQNHLPITSIAKLSGFL